MAPKRKRTPSSSSETEMDPERERASSSGTTTYQIFLSFRGPDTRQGFTDTLYHSLTDAGICVFRDNEEIPKGEYIGDKILRAINESRIFVPIFSRGYASSKWCLLELSKMFESMEASPGSNRKILPIFYDVEVDDVKLKTERYDEALQEHKKNFGEARVKPWEEALKKAGKIKGWELKDMGHAEFAKLIVTEVSRTLKAKHKYVTDCLVQRDDPVEALMNMLDTEASDVRFVGIHGMGGIGKTTLAKMVFNKLCDGYAHCCFLDDVRALSQRKDIEHLQDQLLRGLGFKFGKNVDVGDRIMKLSQQFRQKKVLIVLDDVDHMSQIQNLARDASWFGKGSRIIITTRNQEVLVRMDKTFELTEMNAEEALQLFCKHAFGMDSPPNDYNNLSKEAVESTGRLPLTLEVIGLQLRHEPHEEWAEIIERLKKIPHKDVQKKLLISYESLSHGAQQIFLDIACFFIGYGNTNPMYMWEACKFDAKMGLKELINKSLVKIVVVDLNGPAKEETFRMHDQLRDLGRDIAKHNRIWMREDALNFLRNMEDEVNVEMFRLCDNDYYFRPEDIDKISCEEFSGLKKLRYFECRGAIFSCNMQGLLPNLRWLSWRCCPVEFTGTCLSLKKLVILDLSRSDITEDWIGWSKIGEANNLKVLDLTGCDKLRRTPDLSNYSSLERLILEDCEDLVEIDRSIGRLKGLKFLNFNNCISLSGLPDELYSLDRLEVILGHPDLDDWPTDPPTKIFNFTKSVGNLTSLLTLRFCLFKTTRLPESIIRLSRLRHLALAGIVELPQRVGLLKELKTLELTDCPDMEKLPDSIGDMKSLVELNLSRSGITELPETIGNLEQLRVIDLTESQIHKLPNSIGKLKSLEELLVGSSSLVEIPTTIEGCSSLRIMDLNGCGNMEKLPDSIGYLTSLTELDLSETNFIELPSIVENLKELRMIRIDYSKIRELPPSIGMLKKLEELSAVHCVSFREIPSAIEGCTSLRELKLNNCADLKKLPDSVGNLRSLHELNLSRSGIIELPETIGNLNELTMLFVDHTGIQRLPASIGMLQSLQKLSALNCVSLREIPSTIEGCTLLKELDLNNCQNIRKLPDSVGNLRSLHKLDLSRSGIIELPETIGNLEALSFLSVDGTEIRRLPANIGMLKNLEELRATGCHLLEEIPPSIDGCTRLNVLGLKGCKNIKELSVSGCSLRSLQELNLSFSGMTELPETIGNLEALRVLSVDGTEIRRLPAKIGMLKNLKVLRATDCHLLEEIPSTIDGFTQLMKLDLKGCKNIKELPVSGCFLRSLKVLDLSCTGITELPDTIESLKKLGSLSVDGTQIRSLPASIGMLKKLRHLTARGCHLLEEIPSTIEGCTRLMTLDLKGCKNIKELPFSKCFLRSLFWLHLPDHLYVDNAGVIRSRSKLKIFGAEIDMSPNIPSDPES